ARAKCSRILQERDSILRGVRRDAPQHDAADLLRSRDRKLGGKRRAELIAEDIDLAQSGAVQKLADGAGQLGNCGFAARRIRAAMTRKVRRIDAAIVAELLQHRQEQSPGAAAV